MAQATKTPESPSRSGSNPATLVLVGAIVVIAVAAVIAILFSGGDDDVAIDSTPVTDGSGASVSSAEFGEIILDGDPLPRFTDPSNDAAVGLPAPEITGLSYTGEQVDIPFDGRPKMIAFLAHWCPHCQRELPEIVNWLDSGGLPDDVDLYVVATGTQEGQPNFPPSEWFQREGLTGVPVIMDDTESSAAAGMGLPGYPYWVVVDSAGLVAFRTAGEISAALSMEPADAFAFLADTARGLS